jgi:pSer/pThr/pTyr-binding forkhead associated (FHA) protein
MTTAIFFPVEGAAEEAEEELALSAGEFDAGVGVLVIKGGPDAGSRYVLDNDVTRVGRHPESDIFLDDITVSRRHAEFVREEHLYKVVDVGSLNGTYVNRERIDATTLNSGDEVQIGKFKLFFLLPRTS